MPKILPDSPLLAGFDTSGPPVIPDLFGPVWGGAGGVQGWAKSAWADANFQQWSSFTGKIVGSIAVKDGLPAWNAEGFGQFFSKMPVVRGKDVESMALGAAAKLVSAGLALAATAIPVVGWVVSIGIGLFTLVSSALASTPSDKRSVGEALIFKPDTNRAMAEQLLGIVRNEDDWTDLFSPPSTSGEWVMRSVAWTPGGGGEGYAFGVDGQSGRGLVPGLAKCVGTLPTNDGNINYQFARTSSNHGLSFGSEYDLPPLDTAGSLAPTSGQIAMLVWQMVMKPSVAMFRIDPYALGSKWTDYYLGLAEFADTLKSEEGVNNAFQRSGSYGKTWSRGDNPNLPHNEAVIATTYMPFAVREQDEGRVFVATPDTIASYDTSAQIVNAPEGVTLDKLLSVNKRLTYTYSDLVVYVCNLHVQRAMLALETLVCAYVGPDMALIKASANHREKWLGMRRLLLEHPAVMDVELGMIPDQDYRADVQRAQFRRPDLGFKAGSGHRTPIRTKPGAPPTVDGRPAPDMPDSPGAPSGGSRPGGSRGGGGSFGSWVVPAVGVLAVTAAGMVVLRRRRR